MSRFAVLSALAFLCATQAHAAANSCPGTNTVEMNQCEGDALAQDEATHQKYAKAALAFLQKQITDTKDDDTVKVLKESQKAFQHSETAWKAYRDAECGAVFTNWQQGTLRVMMQLGCDRRLTRQRTYTIWQNWLTFQDSTPPVLPRPETDLPDDNSHNR